VFVLLGNWAREAPSVSATGWLATTCAAGIGRWLVGGAPCWVTG
jgi:hypothetical protein